MKQQNTCNHFFCERGILPELGFQLMLLSDADIVVQHKLAVLADER